jgi:hypothetical protein
VKGRAREGGEIDVTRAGERPIRIPAGPATLLGDLVSPDPCRGIVLFAHGSGSGRLSPRNRSVASVLREAGLATLLMDLLTADEESAEARTGHLRFDIALLAERLLAATDLVASGPTTGGLPIGYFGASTGAAGGPTWPATRSGA